MGTVGYLLDTHTFLWIVRGSNKLSDTAKKAIEDTDVPLYISAASAYEIMNKHRLGKLCGYEDIAENFFSAVQLSGADGLPINSRHANFAGKFEWTHRDPFDRLLAAQAFTEKLTLITNDEAFDSLPWVSVLW
jgi:PIN domain nuclease of toxin-antitoxin system